MQKNDRVVLYSGAIGEKQGLESILYIAESFKDVTDLKFIICGSGPYKRKLEDLKNDLEVDNVIFLSLAAGRSVKQIFKYGRCTPGYSENKCQRSGNAI